MKKLMFVLVIILIILSYNISNSKVVGEYSYRICLDDCCRECLEYPKQYRDNITFDSCYGASCKQNRICSECLDNCMNELQENNPEVAKQLRDLDIVKNTPKSSTCVIHLCHPPVSSTCVIHLCHPPVSSTCFIGVIE